MLQLPTPPAPPPAPPLTTARQHIDDPIWKPSVRSQFSQFECGEGRDTSWLQHHCVAGGQTGGHFPGHHHEGVVPRDNEAHDAEGGGKEGKRFNQPYAHTHKHARTHAYTQTHTHTFTTTPLVPCTKLTLLVVAWQYRGCSWVWHCSLV